MPSKKEFEEYDMMFEDDDRPRDVEPETKIEQLIELYDTFDYVIAKEILYNWLLKQKYPKRISKRKLLGIVGRGLEIPKNRRRRWFSDATMATLNTIARVTIVEGVIIIEELRESI